MKFHINESHFLNIYFDLFVMTDKMHRLLSQQTEINHIFHNYVLHLASFNFECMTGSNWVPNSNYMNTIILQYDDRFSAKYGEFLRN